MDQLDDFISEYNTEIENFHRLRQKAMDEAFEKHFCVIERSEIEQAVYETYPRATIYEIAPASVEDAILSSNVGDQFPYAGWILQAWRCEYALEFPLHVEASDIHRKDIIKKICYVVLPVRELRILQKYE